MQRLIGVSFPVVFVVIGSRKYFDMLGWLSDSVAVKCWGGYRTASVSNVGVVVGVKKSKVSYRSSVAGA